MNSQIQYMCQLLSYEKYKQNKPTQKHIYLTSKQSRMQQKSGMARRKMDSSEQDNKTNGILAQTMPR